MYLYFSHIVIWQGRGRGGAAKRNCRKCQCDRPPGAGDSPLSACRIWARAFSDPVFTFLASLGRLVLCEFWVSVLERVVWSTFVLWGGVRDPGRVATSLTAPRALTMLIPGISFYALALATSSPAMPRTRREHTVGDANSFSLFFFFFILL